MARQFLHPSPERGAPEALEELRRVDLVTSLLLARQHQAGMLMTHLVERGTCRPASRYAQRTRSNATHGRAVVGRARAGRGGVWPTPTATWSRTPLPTYLRRVLGIVGEDDADTRGASVTAPLPVRPDPGPGPPGDDRVAGTLGRQPR